MAFKKTLKICTMKYPKRLKGAFKKVAETIRNAMAMQNHTHNLNAMLGGIEEENGRFVFLYVFLDKESYEVQKQAFMNEKSTIATNALGIKMEEVD